MTIDEAIKSQEFILKTLPVTLAEKEKAAIKLGIEALKWRQHDEREVPNWAATPLPGETKD